MKYYIITYNKAPIGESGECCKSKYDFENACDFCGTGAKLEGNLKVKGFARANKDFFMTLDGDFIISKRFYEIIKLEITNFLLKPVVDNKNNILDFYHFYSTSTLPKFEKESTGYSIDGQCKHCTRNGYFNHAIIGDSAKNTPTIISPLELVYKKETFESYKGDFILKTWECIGYSNKTAYGNNIVGYARPWILIREDIKFQFEKERIKGIEYEEIILRED
jgi:hypothetical protein